MVNKPLYLEATIKVDEATEALREKASSIIDLPKEEDKQIDLMYFTAIFVSSGENLNHAFFEPKELLKAEKTIVNKALDIEHKEKEIIGHIYDRVFTDVKGNVLSLEDLKNIDSETLNAMELHVAIAGIIYKSRFPEVAEEVANSKWKVSMEAYYKNFDLKIGNLLLTIQEAEAMGYSIDKINSSIGKIGKIFKKGKEIATGSIARVLRDITFSGCGIVENPANPPSIILEVAEHKQKTNDCVLTFDYDLVSDNKLTSSSIGCLTDDKEVASDPVIVHNDTVGICVYYKRRVEDKEGNITKEDWCSKFDTSCTSPSREATDVNCLLNKSVAAIIKSKINNKKLDVLLKKLYSSIEKTY